jgi:cell division protein FtsQ
VLEISFRSIVRKSNQSYAVEGFGMADIASVSRRDLAQRRQKLRRRRRIKIIQTIWQTIAVSALASSLLWVTVQPAWVIKTNKDVEVSGNQLLKDEFVREHLELPYPRSLWRIEPSKIATSLEKMPAIAHANVTRRLFPPGLIVEVKERIPIAVAQKSDFSANGTKKTTVGLIDITGILMPIEAYQSVHSNFKLPTLKIIGSVEQYRGFWTQLYQTLSQSSLKVSEIDCQDPTNTILKTELGKVHLGAIGPQLPQQIKVLIQMRDLPRQVNTNQIEYIDLKNPESPFLQFPDSTKAPKRRLSP